MRSADNLISTSNVKNDDLNKGNVEVQDEEESVYKDLLKGEVTQEVRELRHEMYYAERESHKYKYIGNGLAEKKNTLFEETYEGIENSECLPIQLVQINNEDTGGVTDALEIGDWREFDIKIERDFASRFRLEQFANKIVVKRIDDKHVQLDIYTTIYHERFNALHYMFVDEIEKIYEGDTQSDLLKFDKLSFVTRKSWGVDELREYAYNNIKFFNIIKYNGDYVLKFTADVLVDGNDIVQEFYDKVADMKNKNHEPRKKKTVYGIDAMKDTTEQSGNISEAEKIIEMLR